MRYAAVLAIILALELPTYGSGPARTEKAVAAAKAFDGVNHRNFVGNIVGLQLPTPKPPLLTAANLKMLVIPELAIQWLEEWAEDGLIDLLTTKRGKARPVSIWPILKDMILRSPSSD
jgi:hypothetical protein